MMSKTDFAILLLPSIVVIAIALEAYSIAHSIPSQATYPDREKYYKKWELFFEKLDSGKSEIRYDKVTQDGMVEQIRSMCRMAADEQAAYASTGELIQYLAQFLALGTIGQVAVVLLVRKRLKKQQSVAR